MNHELLPPINAVLNGTSTVLLACGLWQIKRGRWAAHAWLMGSAFVVSCLFLALYLTHKVLLHQQTGAYNVSTQDVRPAWARLAYLLVLLLPHLVLAVVMLPMILGTLFRAWRRNWAGHRKLARPTFWIWLYVSVTGVIIYLVLYHVFPALRDSAGGAAASL